MIDKQLRTRTTLPMDADKNDMVVAFFSFGYKFLYPIPDGLDKAGLPNGYPAATNFGQ